MKRFTLPLLALGASLAAGPALAQNKAAAPAAAAPAPKQQKLVRVATINGVDANREFQQNVQIMQAQRQAAIQLNTAWEQEKDPKKKADLRAQLDKAMAKLNADNEQMTKAYGFSLARNYTIVIETAHIYMFVTDEEAAAAEKAEAEAQKKAATQKAPPAKKK